jgi:molybdate transport system substrate-binding protein
MFAKAINSIHPPFRTERILCTEYGDVRSNEEVQHMHSNGRFNNQKVRSVMGAAVLSIMLIASVCTVASADEIRVLYVGALRSSLEALIPDFEKTSGHKIIAEAGAVGAMVTRIQNGESVDVVIVTAAQIAALLKQGKIVAGTEVNLAQVGMGLAAHHGMAKQDISSAEVFERALLAAKSIGHTDPASGASSAIYAEKLLARLDIASEIKSKIRTYASNALLLQGLASGDVEVAFGQLTELMEKKNIDLVGPLPVALQNFSRFSAGVPTTAKDANGGKAFIDFLRSPAAAAAMKAKGVEPL